MKKLFFSFVFLNTLNIGVSEAQEVLQSQVPSVIVNHFQQQFTNAFDVEWKKQPNGYQVEFETGLMSTDHEIWYDEKANILRHKQEIAKSDLPAAVLDRIQKEFGNVRIEDVSRISELGNTTYVFEIDTSGQDFKVQTDNQGNILSQIVD